MMMRVSLIKIAQGCFICAVVRFGLVGISPKAVSKYCTAPINGAKKRKV